MMIFMTQHFIEKKRQTNITLIYLWPQIIILQMFNIWLNVYILQCILFVLQKVNVFVFCLFTVCEYILSVLQSINVSCLFYRYARVEVPLHIVPSSGLGKACLESLIELPKILCQEEEEEYKKATADPELDLITKLQNSSGILHSLFCMSQVLEVRKLTPLLESH